MAVKQNKMARRRIPNRRNIRRTIIAMAEQKTRSLINTGNAITTAGTVINLSNNIVQGDDTINRNGNLITIVSDTLEFRCQAVATSQSFRAIWFRDNLNKGSTPTVTELLESASFMARYNPTTLLQRRFTIFRDVALDCSIAGKDIQTAVMKRGNSDRVFYNGATAVAASNGNGATFLLVIGSAATGSFDFSDQIRFVDF